MCINHDDIFVDRNLKRTSPYLETHILVGVRLLGVYSFLRLAFLPSVSPSPRAGAKALHHPAKHFPFKDGSDDAVRGLLCRRIIAELCRFPYQPRLLVGRQEQLDMRTPQACSREKFYLTHVRLLSEVFMGGWRHLIITRIKCDVPLPVFGSGFILLTL